MKYCQGPLCHTHKTKDRIRGHKGDKHYETRKRSHLYYNGNFCSLMCQDDWFYKFGDMAINHFGRVHEPKRTDASGAWYKAVKWRTTETTGQSRYNHFFVNDLLGEKIAISQVQYEDRNYTAPFFSSATKD